MEFTSARLGVLGASARQPAAWGSIFDSESGGKLGVRASISAEWPIFSFIATHLQLHLDAQYDNLKPRPSWNPRAVLSAVFQQTISTERELTLVPLQVPATVGAMGSRFAFAENRCSLVCAAVARQIDPHIAAGPAVHFIEPEMDERRKALQRIPAGRREAGSHLAAPHANLAFHETRLAAAATNIICAGQAMAAIAPGALASHVPHGREFDRLQ